MGMLVISAETVIGLRNGPEMAQLSKNPPEIYAQLSPFTLCIFTKKVSIHGIFLPRCVGLEHSGGMLGASGNIGAELWQSK